MKKIVTLSMLFTCFALVGCNGKSTAVAATEEEFATKVEDELDDKDTTENVKAFTVNENTVSTTVTEAGKLTQNVALIAAAKDTEVYTSMVTDGTTLISAIKSDNGKYYSYVSTTGATYCIESTADSFQQLNTNAFNTFFMLRTSILNMVDADTFSETFADFNVSKSFAKDGDTYTADYSVTRKDGTAADSEMPYDSATYHFSVSSAGFTMSSTMNATNVSQTVNASVVYTYNAPAVDWTLKTPDFSLVA